MSSRLSAISRLAVSDLITAASTVVTVPRLRRFLRQAPPPPLQVTEQARRAGMDKADLLAVRELADVVVHVAPDSRYRVEPRQAAP